MRIKSLALSFLIVITGVQSESHTIHFRQQLWQRNCAYTLKLRCANNSHYYHVLPKPTLVQAGNTLSTGADYTSNGSLVAAIAYLQTGDCLPNSDNCVIVETSLINLIVPGSGSGTDLSLIPPHEFSVTTGFEYINGCDGVGATCDNPYCNTAFHSPDDGRSVVVCFVNDVDITITFC